MAVPFGNLCFEYRDFTANTNIQMVSKDNVFVYNIFLFHTGLNHGAFEVVPTQWANRRKSSL